MKTYFTILQKLCNSQSIIFPTYHDSFTKNQSYWENYYTNEKSNSALTQVYFFMKRIVSYKENLTLHDFIHKKHLLLNTARTRVVFRELQDELIEIIYKTQRIYYGFALLAKIFRSKRKIINDNDLLLSPIDLSNKNIIKIFHENGNYAFTVRDMTSLINNALSNTENYFAMPRNIKNPYINTDFSNSLLYTIFIKMRSIDCIIPVLFQRFYLCDFNINNFMIENEYLIRDEAILRDVYKPNEAYLFNHICSMINFHFNNKRKISKHIDKSSFIKIMRPYYYLYLIGHFHVHGLTRTNNAMVVFRRRIFELFEYNPKFGRIIMRKHPSKKGYYPVSDLDHPEFTMHDAKKLHKTEIIYENTHIRFEYNDENTHINNYDDDDDDDDDDDMPSLITDDDSLSLNSGDENISVNL